MPPTDLQRTALRAAYQEARDAHPGLMIQRGLAAHDDNRPQAKQDHVKRICAIPASDRYRRQYLRWLAATVDPLRFRQVILRLDTRLFIGLSAGAMLETGCAVGHSHGVPTIPGSAIKGPVQAQVRASPFGDRYATAVDELFGAEPNARNPLGLSGIVTFHDAWWVPDSAPVPAGQPPSHAARPFVQEVVTTHHPDYYQHEGARAASDFDSPIPNAQIAVHGSFLFVVEGDPAWTDLAEQMLIDALTQRGLGAKTRSGYGLFSLDQARMANLAQELEKQAAAAVERAEAEVRLRAQAEAKAAFDNASAERQQVMRVEGALKAFLAGGALAPRDGLVGELNALAKAAANWPDGDDCIAAADLIERAFDAIGWGDPGKNRAQRDKQAAKRQGVVAALRDGASPGA